MQESIEGDCEKKTYHINGNWQSLDNDSPNAELVPYFDRINHCCFYYKNSIFIYGGQMKGAIVNQE